MEGVKKKVYVVYHCFYDDYEDDLEILNQLNESFDVQLLMNNISGKRLNRGLNEITKNALVFNQMNRGKDLAGKLFCLEAVFKLNLKDAPVLFLHDKKSPQANDGNVWKEKLFKCADLGFSIQAVKYIEKGSGIVCTKESLMSADNLTKHELVLHHEDLIDRLTKKFDLKVNDFSFVGGTMFWSHTKYYRNVFDKINVKETIDNFEQGNVLDLEKASWTHAWERVLSYIVTGQNKSIKAL